MEQGSPFSINIVALAIYRNRCDRATGNQP
jgi:hypothetical protein